jgi:hypothetical protein
MPEVPTGETHGLYATESAFCFDASTVLYWVNGEEILCELPPIRNPNFGFGLACLCSSHAARSSRSSLTALNRKLPTIS